MTSAGATRGLLVASAPPAPGRARPIAYLGSSVTVQRREGYQPRLHAALCSALGRAHRPVRAAVGGTGSITGLYMLDDLVLYHAPELCVIEFVPTDTVGATPPAVLEAVLEALVIRLRTHECEPASCCSAAAIRRPCSTRPWPRITPLRPIRRSPASI